MVTFHEQFLKYEGCELLDTISSGKRVLFVSVHPDDETLGCGGTILKHKNVGDSIFWLNLTGRPPGHPTGFKQEAFDKRNELLERIKTTYGFNHFINLLLPTIMLDTFPMYELVGKIDAAISELTPDWIYIPNRSDVHSDHQMAFQAVYSCTKNFRKPYLKKILMYETLSESEFSPALAENAFIPNLFVDITEFMDRKIEIMKMYDTEIMLDPLPRSVHAVKGLAAYRGTRIGVVHAEAFMILTEIA